MKVGKGRPKQLQKHSNDAAKNKPRVIVLRTKVLVTFNNKIIIIYTNMQNNLKKYIKLNLRT